MKAMLVSQESLLWRLASVYGPMQSWARGTDVCSLTRAAIGGLFVCAICTLLGALALASIGDAVLWLYVVMTVGNVDPGILAYLVVVLALMATLLTLIVYIKRGCVATVTMIQRTLAVPPSSTTKQPSFFVVAHRAFKDMYCIPVTITAEKE